ncbi:hypothetical protein PR048_004634 [Dryococelus australis]|uniref:Uncharacterized protein n=1 Tax=Dryococelus australis TaxID=614101 RepID=A0ABQ9I6Z2_9NEOP|nr:hypothetical protein PR048_004634 [Dryococelus australis]
MWAYSFSDWLRKSLGIGLVSHWLTKIPCCPGCWLANGVPKLFWPATPFCWRLRLGLYKGLFSPLYIHRFCDTVPGRRTGTGVPGTGTVTYAAGMHITLRYYIYARYLHVLAARSSTYGTVPSTSSAVAPTKSSMGLRYLEHNCLRYLLLELQHLHLQQVHPESLPGPLRRRRQCHFCDKTFAFGSVTFVIRHFLSATVYGDMKAFIVPRIPATCHICMTGAVSSPAVPTVYLDMQRPITRRGYPNCSRNDNLLLAVAKKASCKLGIVRSRNPKSKEIRRLAVFRIYGLGTVSLYLWNCVSSGSLKKGARSHKFAEYSMERLTIVQYTEASHQTLNPAVDRSRRRVLRGCGAKDPGKAVVCAGGRACMLSRTTRGSSVTRCDSAAAGSQEYQSGPPRAQAALPHACRRFLVRPLRCAAECRCALPLRAKMDSGLGGDKEAYKRRRDSGSLGTFDLEHMKCVIATKDAQSSGIASSILVVLRGQYQLGFPLVDVKYRVVSGVVWTNRTIVNSNTDTNRTGVLAVVDIAFSLRESDDICSTGTPLQPMTRAARIIPGRHCRPAGAVPALVHILPLSTSQTPDTSGAAVAERLDCSPPTKVNRIQSPAGGPLAMGIVQDDAASRRAFSVISRFPHPCILALLQSHIISHSPALNTSLLRAGRLCELSSTLPPPMSRTPDHPSPTVYDKAIIGRAHKVRSFRPLDRRESQQMSMRPAGLNNSSRRAAGGVSWGGRNGEGGVGVAARGRSGSAQFANRCIATVVMGAGP